MNQTNAELARRIYELTKEISEAAETLNRRMQNPEISRLLDTVRSRMDGAIVPAGRAHHLTDFLMKQAQAGGMDEVANAALLADLTALWNTILEDAAETPAEAEAIHELFTKVISNVEKLRGYCPGTLQEARRRWMIEDDPSWSLESLNHAIWVLFPEQDEAGETPRWVWQKANGNSH